MTIDGYSQPGAEPNTLTAGNDAVLKIVLSGGSAGPGVSGLRIEAANSTVKGLVVNGWVGEGLTISGSSAAGNKITGNYIGTDAAGKENVGNFSRGVLVSGAPNNTIGGPTAGARNVISGNGSGVYIFGAVGMGANGNKIVGNYVGTDRSGKEDLGNSSFGVHVFNASDTVVGARPPGGQPDLWQRPERRVYRERQ